MVLLILFQTRLEIDMYLVNTAFTSSIEYSRDLNKEQSNLDTGGETKRPCCEM